MPERPQNDRSKTPSLSRFKQLEARGETPDMPPVDQAISYLISHLYEVGPAMQGAAGSIPVTFTEFRAWMDLTGVELRPWEVRILRRLSGAYLSELYEAEKPDRPAPWTNEWEASGPSTAADGMKAAIRRLAEL